MSERDVYGKYQMLARIAAGGMAEVWLARSSSIGGFEKILAMKRMHPRLCANRGFISLFIEEAKLSVALNHPNVVQVFDFGRVDDNYYIAMEYVEGVDLATLGARSRDLKRPLPVDAVAYLLHRTFEGLGYAHNKRDRYGRPAGIIHRDISPHNILVSYEGQVKISDFGIAKAAEELKRSEKGEVVGKVAYMSPELARGEVITTASDIWGGGVILHELLCNTRLFARPTDQETLAAVAQLSVPRPSLFNPTVPPALDAITMRILDRDLTKRPDDAREVASALSDLLHSHYPRMDDYRLADVIRDLYDGNPPYLLATIENQDRQLGVGPAAHAAPFEHTMPSSESGAIVELEEDTEHAPFASPAPAHAPPLDHATPLPDSNWALDPFAGASGRTQFLERRPSLTNTFPSAVEVPKPGELPDDVRDQVGRIGVEFQANPNLWLVVDIGQVYENAKLQKRALAAYRVAAAKFAQRGLLVQAVAIYRMILERVGESPALAAEIERLPGLAGMSDAELMLEIFDPTQSTDQSEFQRLFEPTGAHPKPIDIFAPAPMLSALGPQQLSWLVTSLRIKNVAAGADAITEGAAGDSFFWIARGRVVVATTNYEGRRVYLTSLSDGDCFGEQSFFTGRPRAATVEALDDTQLIEVDAPALDRLTAEFPPVEETLRQFYKDRVAESVLARSEIFGRMSVRDRRLLAQQFSFVSRKKGDMIICEGEQSDAFYAVRSGKVEVAAQGVDKPLAELAGGEVFGEIAALKGIARTASVKALENCELLRLEAADLRLFLDQNAEIRSLIEAQIMARADQTARKLSGDN